MRNLSLFSVPNISASSLCAYWIYPLLPFSLSNHKFPVELLPVNTVIPWELVPPTTISSTAEWAEYPTGVLPPILTLPPDLMRSLSVIDPPVGRVLMTTEASSTADCLTARRLATSLELLSSQAILPKVFPLEHYCLVLKLTAKLQLKTFYYLKIL